MSTIFHQIFIFHHAIALQKLWEMFFISSKKLFSLSRYSNFCIFIFPSFFPVSHCFRGLNNNLITCFVWYLEKEIRCDIETLAADIVLNTEDFYGKNHIENVHQKLVPDPFLILPNNTKKHCMLEIILKTRILFNGQSY